ncbi:MAG TPA: type IV pilin protein [Nevskia sp.]|nr:type IV pilin protein [Nevskia sp.]
MLAQIGAQGAHPEMNATHARPRAKMPGFSFVELLVMLAIVALLSVFGLPALLQYGLQDRLATAQTLLKQIAGQQSQWLADHRVYASLNQLGYPVDSAVAAIYLSKDGSVSGHASADAIYRISVRLGSPSIASVYYLITAEPVNDQARDRRCGTLSLASTGQVGASGAEGEAGCWRN